MSKCVIPISHGHYTSIILKTGLFWSKVLNLDPLIFHVLSGDKNLELSDALNHELKLRIQEIRNVINQKAIKNLHKVIEDNGGTPNVIDSSYVLYGDVHSSIKEQISEHEGKILILGPKTRNEWGELFLGSNTERLLKILDIPVLVAKEERAISPDKIFWPSDLTDLADSVLEWIIKFSKVFHSEIHLCHVVRTNSYLKNYDYHAKLEEVEKTLKENRVNYNIEIIENYQGSVEGQIKLACENANADLVVFGAKRKRSVLDLFLGGVEEYLIHNIKQSFFLVNVPKE